MDLDDVVYLLCLISCYGCGYIIRRIKDDNQRKLLATMFGVLIVLIVSGFHSLHCLTSFVLCASAIKYLHPSKCHVASFIIMFGYLTFFRTTSYFGLPPVPGHTNLIQMLLTLKISGLAFEKNAAYNKIAQRERSAGGDQIETKSKIALSDYDVELQSITFTEMFHYSFNYFGVLTGPYYRYRTYRDYFETPFKDYVNTSEVTIKKIIYPIFYGVVYLLVNYFWPLNRVMTKEFYLNHGFLFRLFYIVPTFLSFRTRLYIGLLLSECACIYAGFGAYPDEANVTQGGGPTVPYLHLKRNAHKRSYNFKTIENMRVYDIETSTTMRKSMKSWNICIQYWLAVNVYKQFPSKQLRTIATLLTSSFWHGFMPGHYFCIMGAAFYVPVEDMLFKLYRKDATGIKAQILDVLFWLSNNFMLSYLGMAFILQNYRKFWYYYSSVYYVGYLYWAILMVFAVLVTKSKRASNKQRKRALEKQGQETHKLTPGKNKEL